MLGSIDNVRALASWPSTEEVPDSEITEALAAATRRVVTMTGVEEASWSVSPTSVNKPLADETAEICAASNIVMRVSGIDKVVERRKDLQMACADSMALLVQALGQTEADSPSFIDVNAEYTTYPLNPYVDPYDPLV